jgi:hypothetical protein
MPDASPRPHDLPVAREERALPERSLDAAVANVVPPMVPSEKRITIPMAIGTVVLFWWLATGVIVAVERNDTTRLIGVIVASWLAVLVFLAAFEYLVLALPTELPLWDTFLRARGG